VAPVQLFAALLWADEEALRAAGRKLEGLWGPVDHAGQDHPFDVTEYYEREMGPGLKRRLVAYERLVQPEALVEAKLAANAVEAELRGAHGRRVNIDAGYLDHAKVVLASMKYAGQKIHLGRGVYADMVLRFRDGKYRPFEWTFPDFRDGRFDADLAAMRATYLAQLRGSARGTSAQHS
jgi:hypothetical protein